MLGWNSDRTTEGAEFWITCKRLAFLSSFSHLQVIQNQCPLCLIVAYVTAGLVSFWGQHDQIFSWEFGSFEKICGRNLDKIWIKLDKSRKSLPKIKNHYILYRPKFSSFILDLPNLKKSPEDLLEKAFEKSWKFMQESDSISFQTDCSYLFVLAILLFKREQNL